MQNKTINGYTLKRKIGEGGMAEVWQAENKLGKKAAVKILLPALTLMPEVITRFENEARAMVTLEHPNIRQVYDYDSIDGRPCIIMEYLEGGDLSHRLKRGERFSSEQCRNWWNQLAEALNYTHKQGIVHRDIKPSNIFLCDNGTVKLLDFGIAKVRDSVTITQTGSRMGTLMYMSPEQVKDSKHLDYRSDVYSLAVTFYHLLTGAAPYDNTKSSEFEILTKIVTEPLHLDLLPTEWHVFLQPYLNKEAEDRPELKKFDTKISDQTTEETVLIPGGGEQPKPGKYTETVNGVSFDMVEIPAGTFTMGSPADEPSRESDETQHSVTLSSYYMGAKEVTQELWKAVMGTSTTLSNPSYYKGDNLPVESVSWDDCQEFIRKLNQLTGKSYRLPTEAEWEYACRAGTTTPFNTGNNLTTSQANYNGNYPYNGNAKGKYLEQTMPVGSYPPNAWGLYDMHGNVWEWCSDWYGDYPTGAQTNPQGPSTRSCRVIRGGSWSYDAQFCRSALRIINTPDFSGNPLGFRLVSPE